VNVADEGDERGGDQQADSRMVRSCGTAGVSMASAASRCSIILIRRSSSRISEHSSTRAGRSGSGMSLWASSS